MEKVWLKSYPKGVAETIDLNQYKSLIELMNQSFSKFRNKNAFTNMGKTLTFNDMDRLSGDFASYLQNELGLKKGDRIAIQMPNLLQYPIIMFGAIRAGLIVVNTNPLYTAKEMQHQFKDSGAKVIVILSNFAHLLDQVIAQTDIQHVIVTDLGDMLGFPKSLIVNNVVKHIKKMVPDYKLEGHHRFLDTLKLGAKKAFTPVDSVQSDIAFLQYTGGTTGVSKGAVLSHKNIIANVLQICEWMKPKLREGEEIVITALPLYHIFSLTVNCFAFMRYGGENILITNPKDIPGFVKELQKHKFTTFTGVNTLYNALMNHPNFGAIDFSSLKICVAGAMALQSSVAERWKSKTGIAIVEGYGLTETSPVANCNPIDGTDRVGTIGMPLPSTEVKIIDDNEVEVANGSAGEICVRGPQVMEGYWQRPDETAKVMTKDGWLKTGDVAVYSSDGFFKIVDRKKDMILVSGFNVYPNEVEDAIASHPGVLEVAAIGVADEKSGEVVKVVIVKKDPTLTPESVIEHARKSLTSYKIPKYVEFKAELPKTNVGKILRRALRDEAPPVKAVGT